MSNGSPNTEIYGGGKDTEVAVDVYDAKHGKYSVPVPAQAGTNAPSTLDPKPISGGK
jgi:hypothetical protein